MSKTLGQLLDGARRQGSFATHRDMSDQHDWLVGPVGHTRDSRLIDESNWNVTLARFAAIDPEEHDHEIIRFGHWACGWIEELITRPGSACARIAEEIREELDGYPILDEFDYSERESERESENWSDIMHDLKRKLIREAPDLDNYFDRVEDDLLNIMRDCGCTGESDGNGWRSFFDHDVEKLIDALREHKHKSARKERRRVRMARKRRRGWA